MANEVRSYYHDIATVIRVLPRLLGSFVLILRLRAVSINMGVTCAWGLFFGVLLQPTAATFHTAQEQPIVEPSMLAFSTAHQRLLPREIRIAPKKKQALNSVSIRGKRRQASNRLAMGFSLSSLFPSFGKKVRPSVVIIFNLLSCYTPHDVLSTQIECSEYVEYRRGLKVMVVTSSWFVVCINLSN